MITATVGLVPGYNNNSEPDWAFVDVCLKKMAESFGFTYCFKKCLYPTAWGCPVDGEHVVDISAMRNPKFDPIELDWETKIIANLEMLAWWLKQTTAQAYNDVTNEFHYIQPSDDRWETTKRPILIDPPENHRGRPYVEWLTKSEYEAVLAQMKHI